MIKVYLNTVANFTSPLEFEDATSWRCSGGTYTIFKDSTVLAEIVGQYVLFVKRIEEKDATFIFPPSIRIVDPSGKVYEIPITEMKVD